METHQIIRTAASIGALALGALAGAGQGYTVTKIPGNGFLPGSSASYLANNGYVISNSGIYHNGITTPIPTYNGKMIYPSAVNGSGQAVGGYQTGVFNSYGYMMDSVRFSGSTVTPLGAGGTQNNVDFIADDGTILGSTSVLANNNWTSKGWVLKNGIMTNLTPLSSGYFQIYGKATNASGVIVGAAATSNGYNYYHATRWMNNVAQDLGTGNAAFRQSQAVGIDAAGDILIASSHDFGNGDPTNLYLWSNGTMTQLPTFGGQSARSTSMNALGQVVGEAQDSSGAFHSFLWDKSHGMTRLDNLADGTSFFRISVGKINDQGQLLGNGFEYQADGGIDVWSVLLTPQAVPEPMSFVGLGLAVLGVVRRRKHTHTGSQ